MPKVSTIVLTVLVLSVFTGESRSQLSCMDDANRSVDWFIAIKYPRSYDFVYLTPDSIQWMSPQWNLSSDTNMIAQTLNQSYDPQYFYAYYSDDKPIGRANSKRGHLKGVVNFGQDSGYWLIHSVPKFPYVGEYKYGKGQAKYGQSLICVTVATSNLASIVDQLLMMQSTVYSSNVPSKFSQDTALMSSLTNLVKNKNIGTQKSRIISIKSKQQMSFQHFGKSASFGKDLYASLIAPSLKTSLLVQTWIRGHKIPFSNETEFTVIDIRQLKLVNTTFKHTVDHSKWAVSNSSAQPFVCIGDINRMTTQFEKGGGSLCMKDDKKKIWTIFRAIPQDSMTVSNNLNEMDPHPEL